MAVPWIAFEGETDPWNTSESAIKSLAQLRSEYVLCMMARMPRNNNKHNIQEES